jgi:GDP-L-fucose synthase
VFSLEHYSGDTHLNVGTGREISILDLARLVADVIGWSGEYVFDTSMPDGTLRKLLDVSQLADLGWSASIELRDGIARTYSGYVETLPTSSVDAESR